MFSDSRESLLLLCAYRGHHEAASLAGLAADRGTVCEGYSVQPTLHGIAKWLDKHAAVWLSCEYGLTSRQPCNAETAGTTFQTTFPAAESIRRNVQSLASEAEHASSRDQTRHDVSQPQASRSSVSMQVAAGSCQSHCRCFLAMQRKPAATLQPTTCLVSSAETDLSWLKGFVQMQSLALPLARQVLWRNRQSCYLTCC